MGISVVAAVPHPALCIPELGPRKRDAALQHMIAHAREAGAVRDVASVLEAVTLREKVSGSAAGKGVALPHARALAVIEPRWVLARSGRGIDWGAADGAAVHLVLLVLSPPEWSATAHFDAVTRAAAALRLARDRTRLREAAGADAMLAAMRSLTP